MTAGIFFCLLVTMFVELCSSNPTNDTSRSARIKLEKDTFKSPEYDKYQIPVQNHSRPIEVYLGIAIRSLLQTDAFTMTMVANIWIRIYWRDEFITWDPDDYDGIKYQTMPRNEIWVPRLMLFNEGGQGFKTSLQHSRVVITSEGNVTCLFPALVKFVCTFRIRKFPFDKEICNIELAPADHNLKNIDLRLKPDNPADADDFQPTSEWKLMNFSAHQHVHVADKSLNGGDIEEYKKNIYQIVLFRHGWSQLFYTVLPILIIHTVSISQFLLPCEAGEKVSIGFTINLAMGFFLVMVKETFPETDYVVAVVEYIYLTLVVQGLAQMVTIFVLIIHHKGQHDNNCELPQWARTLFLQWLAKLLMVRMTLSPHPTWSVHPSVSETETEFASLHRESTEMEMAFEDIATYNPSESSSLSPQESIVGGVFEVNLGTEGRSIPASSVKSPKAGSVRRSSSVPNLPIRWLDETTIAEEPENPVSSTSKDSSLERKQNEDGEGQDLATVKRHINEIRRSLHKNDPSQSQDQGFFSLVTADEQCRPTTDTKCPRCDLCFTPSKCKCKVENTVQEKDSENIACCCICMKDIIAKKGWSKTLVPLVWSSRQSVDNSSTAPQNAATQDTVSQNAKKQDTARATQNSATRDKSVAQNATTQRTVTQNADTQEMHTENEEKLDTPPQNRSAPRLDTRKILYKKITSFTADLKLVIIEQKRHNDLRSEWRQVAIVVDRLMFLIFLLGSGAVVLKLYLNFQDPN